MRSKEIPYKRRKVSSVINSFLEKIFIREKLNNWVGYLLFICVAVLMGYLIAQKTILGIGITGLLVASAVMICCLFNTEAGMYIQLVYSFFAFYISRLFFNGDLQVGVISDLLTMAILMSLLIKRINFRESINNFTSTSVVTVLLIIYCYTAIQLFNPNANSFDGWYLGFRKTLMTLFLLFAAFNLFDSYEKIKRFITVLFVLCAITGLYGCIQQWHGLFPFERAWVFSDPYRIGLIYIGGDFRNFSTMSDPTAYGILMGACSVFFIAIASKEKVRKNKIIIIVGVVFMLLGMGYSGTRTANAMTMAGLAIFILLSLNNKSTQLLAVITGVIFLFLLYGPINNATIARFRSTFEASEDASYNVREINRKSIQPYIYTHPIGGGLGTTGAAGVTMNRGHFLAGFQPDSGTLKKALETGWIGLTMLFILYFLIIKTGIRGYFTAPNEKFKSIYAGCTAAIFCFYIADYAQVAFGQITDIVVYYPFIAILLKLNQLKEPVKTSTE